MDPIPELEENAAAPDNRGDANIPTPPPTDPNARTLVRYQKRMGKIYNIQDQFVTVQPLPDIQRFETNTMLYLEKGHRGLGHIDAIIAPMNIPYYLLGLESVEFVQSLEIKAGDYVTAIEIAECTVPPPHRGGPIRRRRRYFTDRNEYPFVQHLGPPNRRRLFGLRREASLVRLPPVYPWENRPPVFYRPIRPVRVEDCEIEIVQCEDDEEPNYREIIEEHMEPGDEY